MENKVKIMGIVNITPDSFYDGEFLLNKDIIKEKFKYLLHADIIDIGCESSRPGASPISLEEEISRFKMSLPFLKLFPRKQFSIDTTKYEVAKLAVDQGFTIINNISSGRISPKMYDLVAKKNTKIILMHMYGTPKTMQDNLENNLTIESILSFFNEKIKDAVNYGIDKNNIIIDPGIGFGKTIDENYMILNNLDKIVNLGFPVLVGISRKSFLEYSNDKPIDRLSATIGASSLAVSKGISILRVHDVFETKKMLHTVENILKR